MPFGRDKAADVAPSVLAYRWRLFVADLRHAQSNMHAILHYEPPQIVQLGLGAWTIIQGLLLALFAPAIFATAPRVYAWMTHGLFFWCPPRIWGLVMLVVGLRQWYALAWPHRSRSRLCLVAAKSLQRLWTGLAFGFLVNGVPCLATALCMAIAGGAHYVVWRLLDRVDC